MIGSGGFEVERGDVEHQQVLSPDDEMSERPVRHQTEPLHDDRCRRSAQHTIEITPNRST